MGRLAVSLSDALSGAVMLATGQPAGLGRISADSAGVLRSFWAAALCVPMLLCLRLIDWTLGGVPAAPTTDLARNLLAFAVGWAGFAVVSHLAAERLLDRAERWPGYIAVWNWCNVVQYALLLAAALPALLHAPAPVSEATQLIALGWALWLEWFATRLALNVGPWSAAGLVGLDVAIGLLMAAVA